MNITGYKRQLNDRAGNSINKLQKWDLPSSDPIIVEKITSLTKNTLPSTELLKVSSDLSYNKRKADDIEENLRNKFPKNSLWNIN